MRFVRHHRDALALSTQAGNRGIELIDRDKATGAWCIVRF